MIFFISIIFTFIFLSLFHSFDYQLLPKLFLIKKYNDYIFYEYNDKIFKTMNNTDFKDEFTRSFKNITLLTNLVDFDSFIHNSTNFDNLNIIIYNDLLKNYELNDKPSKYLEKMKITYTKYRNYFFQIIELNNNSKNKIYEIIFHYFIKDIFEINEIFMKTLNKNIKQNINNKNDIHSKKFLSYIMILTLDNENFKKVLNSKIKKLSYISKKYLNYVNNNYRCFEIINSECFYDSFYTSVKNVNIYDKYDYNIFPTGKSVEIRKCCTI